MEVQAAMKYVFLFLQENEQECQFSLKELMDEIKCDYKPDMRTVKAQLIAKYGDGIIISEAHKKPACRFFS